MERDRNLLFGVFAVQLGKVSPHELVQAGGAWAADPNRDLSSVLRQIGAMREKDVRLIEGLVEEAIRAHAGDPAATLEAFGGSQAIQQSFHGSILLTDSGSIEQGDLDFEMLGDDDAVAVLETPGRYSNQREYAKGGMGRVLLVHDVQIGRDVALKELLPHVVGSSDTTEPEQPSPVRMTAPLVARFLREAKITGQLEHPSIVPVYELGRRMDGSVYYTMKLVRGRTLSAAIRQAGSLEERLKLLPHFVDLCQAVAYAHSRGVVHRDIKPGNVMVGEFGETVVLDWGLAKVRDTDDLIADDLAETLRVLNTGDSDELMKTAYGQAIGTPAYMAPEQAKGQLDEIDERTDIYALGVALYELLTGKVPFQGTTLKETLERVISETPPEIGTIEPKVSPELVAVCSKAMMKSKDDRYATAEALAEEIQRFQAGAFVQAYEYRRSEVLLRFVQRHRALFLVGAAAVIALFIVSGMYASSLVRANRLLTEEQAKTQSSLERETAARERAEDMAEDLAFANYAVTIRMAQTAEAAQNMPFAFEQLEKTPARFRNWEWSYLKRQTDDSFFQVSDVIAVCVAENSLITRASSSSDFGSQLRTDTVKIWDVRSGLLMRQYQLQSRSYSWLRSLEFSSSGLRVAWQSKDGRVIVADSLSGKQLLEIKSPAEDARLRLGDSAVAVWNADSADSIDVWHIDSGSRRFRLSFPHDGLYRHRSCVLSDDGELLAIAETQQQRRIGELFLVELLNPVLGSVCLAKWASIPDKITIWNTFSRDEVLQLFYRQFVAWSVNGEKVLVKGPDGLEVWGMRPGELLGTIKPGDGSVREALLPGQDGAIFLWIEKTGGKFELEKFDYLSGQREWVVKYGSKASLVAAPALSSDGSLILCVPPERSYEIDVLDTRSGDVVRRLTSQVEHYRVEFGRDDSLVLAAGGGRAQLWDISTELPRDRFNAHSDSVQTVRFSQDDSKLITASSDSSIGVWNASSFTQIRSFHNPGGTLVDADLSPDGSEILILFSNGVARAVDMASGETRFELISAKGFKSARFSPDGSEIVTTTDYFVPPRTHKELAIWDASTGVQLKEFNRSADFAVFDPSGQILASWGHNYVAILLIDTGETVKYVHLSTPISNHSRRGSGIGRARFNPVGNGLVVFGISAVPEIRSWVPSKAAAENRRLRSETMSVLDSIGWREPGTKGSVPLRGHLALVVDAEFSPDGSRVATASDDGTVMLWDTKSGERLLTLDAGLGAVSSVTFSHDGTKIAAGFADGHIKIWDAGKLPIRAAQTAIAEPDGIVDVDANSDGSRLATASPSGVVKLWDRGSGEILSTIGDDESKIQSTSLSPTEPFLVTVDENSVVRVWNTESGDLVRTLSVPEGRVVSAKYFRGGKMLALAGSHVSIWDAHSWKTIADFPAQTGTRSVSFTRDGTTVVTNLGQIFDVHTGEQNLSAGWRAENTPRLAIIGLDGQVLISSGERNDLVIWDIGAGSVKLTLDDGSGWAHPKFESLATSPNGQRFVAACSDGSVKVFSTLDGTVLQTLKGQHKSSIKAFFTDDGRNIVSASRNGTVEIWTASEW